MVLFLLVVDYCYHFSLMSTICIFFNFFFFPDRTEMLKKKKKKSKHISVQHGEWIELSLGKKIIIIKKRLLSHWSSGLWEMIEHKPNHKSFKISHCQCEISLEARMSDTKSWMIKLNKNSAIYLWQIVP